MSQFIIDRYDPTNSDIRVGAQSPDSGLTIIMGNYGNGNGVTVVGNTAPFVNPGNDVFTLVLTFRFSDAPPGEYGRWEFDSRDFPDTTSSIQALVDWAFAGGQSGQWVDVALEARWRWLPGPVLGDISAAQDGSSPCPPTTPFVRETVITDKDTLYAQLGITT